MGKKKTVTIIGLCCGILLGMVGVTALAVTPMMFAFTGEMLRLGADAKTIEFYCDTCDSGGTIVKGFGEIEEGTACGYIDGEGRRCGGTYVVTERDMTPEEKQKHEEGVKKWESMEMIATFIRSGSVLAILAGLVATVLFGVSLYKARKR